MNIKKATNLQLSTTESKNKNKNKYKKTKQPEQEPNHRCGDHLACYELGGRRWRMGEVVQGLRSIIGRNKIGGC